MAEEDQSRSTSPPKSTGVNHTMSVRIAIIAFVLCFPLGAQAQQDESPQEQPEEVLVIGDRSMWQLRTRMWKVEKEVYDLFNKFNDERRFNISCSVHQPTGTRIERQICAPDFELEATKAHGQAFLDSYRALLDPFNLDYSPPALDQPVAAVIASQQREYKKKMRQVAEEHPEFLEAVIEYSRIRRQYEDATRTGEE